MKKVTLLFSVFAALGYTSLNAQNTCGTATVVTPGSYTAAALTGTGASHAPATAAAWYSFTPGATGLLNISSCGGGTDTRLWIMSGACGSLVAVANNDDAAGCISSGTDEYASRLQNVMLQGGTTYYFEWDNRWESFGFTWSFSYTPFPNNGDAAITKSNAEYTRIPVTQLTGGIVLGGDIQNLSSTPLTNVVLTANVYLQSNLSTPVATFASSPISLAAGITQSVTCGTWNAPANVADYVVVYTKTQTEPDGVAANNTFSQNLTIDYNYYARDNNVMSGALGSAAGGIRQGSQFKVVANDQITGAQFYINTTNNAQQYVVEIYQVTGGTMGATPIYTSPSQTTTGTAGFVNITFAAPVAVTPGEYALVINHTNTTAAANIGLGYTNQLITPLKQWLRIGTGAWAHPEDQGFVIAYMLRPKFGTDPANDVRFVSNSPYNEYSAIHSVQAPAGTPLTFQAVGRNGGTAAATNVIMTVNVKNAANTVVHTAASAPQSLAAATNGTFTATGYTVTVPGTYTIEYVFTADGTDQIPNNNTGTTTFQRSANLMSRAIGTTGALGIGPNPVPGTYDNGMLGQTYTLTNPDVLKSVRFALTAPPANVPVRVEIYNTTGAGVPTGTAIATTTTYTTTAGDAANGVSLDLPISTGTLNLAAGTYFFGVVEQEGNITLATSTQIFTAGKAFVRANGIAGGAWTPVESAGFNIAFVLNPVFNVCVPVTATFTVTNANCSSADGSAQINATGGTGALTYLWSNGQTGATLTGVTSGLYTVTITDASGCTTDTSVTIQDQSTLTATASASNVLCNGGTTGSVTVTPANGQAPYTYTWAGSANTSATLNNVGAGTYTATVTDDNGCTFIVSGTVTQPSALGGSTTHTNVACFGGTTGSVTVSATGGTAPYTYAWSGSASTGATLNNVGAGTYTVTITDANSCVFTATGTVTQPTNAPSVSGTVNNTTSSINITATGGTAPYTYAWSNGATTEDLTGVANGSYTVTVTDANGCTTTGTYTVLNPTSISEVAGLENLNIYPNPSNNGSFAVSIQTTESKDVIVDLISTVGKVMSSQKANVASAHIFNFDVQGYAAGMYTVRISANGQSVSKIIILQ